MSTIPDALPILSAGHHPWGSGKACVMDAVSWLHGRPEEGDAPSCVHPVLRSAAIRVNDQMRDDERHKLWALVPELIGTAPEDPDSLEAKVVSVRLAIWCARQVLPLVKSARRAEAEAAIEKAEKWCEAPSAAAAYAAAAYAAADAAAAAAADAAAAAAAAAYAAAAYAAAAAAYAAAAAAAPRRRALAPFALLEGLVQEHRRVTGHEPRAITDDEWSQMRETLGVGNG